ncbi:PTS sugar transporter subunit IIB [Clostridium sp. L74]|uniref:PTS sugar transporter subunit IIB n=1 Tax=Clostridium sp. L74 TaxID=1560217 RepID=UPI0006ABC5C8|nr:PTS sugar transporter subunit IIB [Clostridium sp. L74]KOR25637.1 cytochrome C biogenesis protein CcmE [Clostridium sp. L74]
MVTIRLFCAAGMSTSIVVNKMKEAAKEKNIEVDIEAFPQGQMDKYLDNVDVALLGPQVAYTLSKSEKICASRGIPIAVIPMVDYGMMNGEKILDFALKLANQ